MLVSSMEARGKHIQVKKKKKDGRIRSNSEGDDSTGVNWKENLTYKMCCLLDISENAGWLSTDNALKGLHTHLQKELVVLFGNWTNELYSLESHAFCVNLVHLMFDMALLINLLSITLCQYYKLCVSDVTKNTRKGKLCHTYSVKAGGTHKRLCRIRGHSYFSSFAFL